MFVLITLYLNVTFTGTKYIVLNIGIFIIIMFT